MSHLSFLFLPLVFRTIAARHLPPASLGEARNVGPNLLNLNGFSWFGLYLVRIRGRAQNCISSSYEDVCTP